MSGFPLLARLAAAAILATFVPAPGLAGEASYPEIEASVPGHPEITYLDLAKRIVPDLAKAGGIYRGHALIDVRHIGGPETAAAPPETISLPGISALAIRSQGQDRLLLLLGLGDSSDSAEGFDVLALYDLSGKPKLLDAADVAYDRDTSFREPGVVAIAPDSDAVVTMSEHFNSSQTYDTTALILPRGDRLELIDTIFTFNERSCAFERNQQPSFATVSDSGSRFAAIAVTVTETTVGSGEAGCGDEEQPVAGTRTIAVTYRWDAAAQRYMPDSDALAKLAAESETRF